MNKKEAPPKTSILLLIILMCSLVSCFQVCNASEMLVVPDNYHTIQEAIQNASTGDTIVVKAGVYYENLLVDKSVSIVGENKETTIIIGTGNVTRGQQTVITLAAEAIEISGFTIKSQNYSSSSLYASGISVEADNCEITDNIIYNTYYGIFCSVQSGTKITKNQISANLKDGIRFCGGSWNYICENNITGNAKGGIALEGYTNTISGNNITNNARGIGMGASFSEVSLNNIGNNSEFNFFFAGSNNTVCSNNITDSTWGIYFSPYFAAPAENLFFNNNFINNQGNIGGLSSHNNQMWDDGSSNGGNYWSDYLICYPFATQVNSSGIMDTPYEINENNSDNFPLLVAYSKTNSHSSHFPQNPQPNSTVAFWPFDIVQPNGVTPDKTGLNFAVVGTSSGDISYTPVLVDGKVGKAFSFDGAAYVNTPILPHLEIADEITIDVWINVQQFKEVKYNNILVECERTRASLPDRTVGLAVNGEASTVDSSIPQGALIAYVSTESEGLNEIVTTESVVTLNEWMHVVFTRSLSTGMHIYIDDKEQNVTVTAGVQNPEGQIQRETELYIGHDAICLIDEIKLSNYATEVTTEQDNPTQFELWIVLIAAISVVVLFVYIKVKH